MHFWRSKYTLDSLKSVFNEFGANRCWVPPGPSALTALPMGITSFGVHLSVLINLSKQKYAQLLAIKIPISMASIAAPFKARILKVDQFKRSISFNVNVLVNRFDFASYFFVWPQLLEAIIKEKMIKRDGLVQIISVKKELWFPSCNQVK